MSKHFDLLYRFITENEDRLELAFDIGTSWEELRKKLILTFQEEIVKSLQTKFGKFNYLVAADEADNHRIRIYKQEWIKEGSPLLCIKVQNILYDDYLGIFRNSDHPLIVSNKNKIDNFFNEKERQDLLNRHMLANPEDNWVAWKYTGNNCAKIENLRNLIGNRRPVLVEQYVDDLKRLTDVFSPHIDRLVEELTL